MTAEPSTDPADPEPSNAEQADAASLEQGTRGADAEALAAAEAKAAENWERYLRAQAEIDNLRKRAERDLENAHKYALERFAGELLAVRDSLELGVQAAASETDPVKLREGTELTLRLLGKVMEKFSIEQLDPLGERFDPERHQAMTMQESAEAEPNTVLAVMQKGYLLSGRLLRPAMVVVAKAPQGADDGA
jgi:molecular chaperone GrpE